MKRTTRPLYTRNESKKAQDKLQVGARVKRAGDKDEVSKDESKGGAKKVLC